MMGGPATGGLQWPESHVKALALHHVDSVCVCVCVCVLAAQSCLTLWDFMVCNPPGSSVHGIFQARILELAAIPFSRGSFQPRDQTQVSCRQILYHLIYQGSPL